MSITVGFSVAERDVPRLEQLVTKFGHGNRSAFLREAIHQMEVVERASRLTRIQRAVASQASEKGISLDEVNVMIKRVLRNTVADRG